MAPFRSSTLLAATVLLFGPGLFAQTQTNPAATQGQTAAQNGGVPLFRTNANLVLVDVVVHNKQQPVLGLKQSDFHISEDGREQKITVFEEHRATDALETVKAPQLPPHVYTNAPHFELTSAANVLLLDGLNTPLSDQVYIRRQMLKFLGTIPPGTRVAVFTLGTSLQMISGFTTNAPELAKALGPGRGNSERSALFDPDFDNATNQELDLANSLGLSQMAISQLKQYVSDTQNFQTGLRLQVTLDALDQLARYLTTIPGRKNLIWFSASFPLRFLEGGSNPNMDPMADFSGQVKKAAELLALSRVAVYPVDTRGLLNTPSSDTGTVAGLSNEMQTVPAGATANGQAVVTQTGGGNAGMGSLSADQLQSANQPGVGGEVGLKDQRFVSDMAFDHFNMDQIAKETGGQAFYNRNALGPVLTEAIANGSSYYTIGYSPEDRNYNGALRQIGVHVEGGRYNLEYRHAYFADNPADVVKWTPGKRNALVDAMQHGTPSLALVVFKVRVLPAGDPALGNETATAGPAGQMAAQLKNPRRFIVDFWIDPRGLDHKTMPDGSQQSQVELTEVAYDVGGIRVNYVDQALGVTQTREQAARSLEAGLPLHAQIDLPAQNTYLRVGVHDMLSGRIGTLEIPVAAGK